MTPSSARSFRSDFSTKARNVFLVAIGIALFLFRRSYEGPLQDLVHAYAGNLSISFALYFVCLNLPVPLRFKKLTAATLTFAAVEMFEAFNGFGVMANTYDPFDFFANAVGIAIAFGVDSAKKK